MGSASQPPEDDAIEHLAELDRLSARALPRLRDQRGLIEVAALGCRTVELVLALEALAIDPSMPSGTALDWTGRGPATRELALFVRAQLGVGPADAARVRGIAEGFSDPIARDLVLAHLADDADATTMRLVQHRRALPQSPEAHAIDLVLGASIALAASHARSRAAREAPFVPFTTTRSSWPDASTRDAQALSYALLPRFGIEEQVPRARPLAPLPVHLANVAPPAPRRALALAAEDDSLGSRGYRAMRAGAPVVDRALLEAISRRDARSHLDALDALVDASALSPDALAFVVDLATGRAGFFDPSVLEAATCVLVAHAPDRWHAWIETLAYDVSPRVRVRAAELLGATPPSGPQARTLLETLEIDPVHVVRRAARLARAKRSRWHDTRLWTRRMLWVALRDDNAATLVFDSLCASPPVVPPSDMRRIERWLPRASLSPRARDRLERAFRGMLVAAAPAAPAEVGGWLTTTDGRSLRVALSDPPGAAPTQHFATIARSRDLTCALPSEVLALTRSAPSRFMRLTRGNGPDVAVTVRMIGGDVGLIADDPRLLERIP